MYKKTQATTTRYGVGNIVCLFLIFD